MQESRKEGLVTVTDSVTPTTTTKGRGKGISRTANAKPKQVPNALKGVGEEIQAFEDSMENQFEGFEQGRVEHLVERTRSMPTNIRNGYVEAMSEVTADPDSFRQDATEIFGSLFGTGGFTMGEVSTETEG